jgi:hypothetical protein
MLKPSSAIMGVGLGQDVALVTDGRFSGGTHGFLIGEFCSEISYSSISSLYVLLPLYMIYVTRPYTHAHTNPYITYISLCLLCFS